jgi:preprotein translocase subunit SecE
MSESSNDDNGPTFDEREQPSEPLQKTNNNNNRVSFDDAGRELVQQEDLARLEESGDFDTNPAYKSDSIEKMRQAIRDKTKEMGLEKSVLSKQVIQQASARAMRGESPNLNNNNALDLTKIRGNIPDNMPTVLYDPEDEMSSQERIEVDPVGQTSLLNQFQNELSNAKWPTAGAVVREVGIMILVVAATAALIILWDAFLRDFYTNELHLIPTKEEINTRFEGLELPEGWTNMMTDDDVANLPSELRDAASSAAATSGGGGGLPDL